VIAQDEPEQTVDAPALRIAFLVYSFPVLSEAFIATLASDLIGRNHDLRILGLEPQAPAGPRHPIVAEAGLEQLVARARMDGRFSARRAFELARGRPDKARHLAALTALDLIAPRRALAVSRMIAAQPMFDIAHCQFGTLGLTALRHLGYGTLRARALVVHLRGSDITSYVEQRGERVYAKLFRKADIFIANCRHFRDRAEALGCPPEKLFVIGSPIDTERFKPPAARRPFIDRPARLVAVGRLVEKKGFEDAIAAVARLSERGRAVHLDILGEGELRPVLEERIAAGDMGGRVSLRGAATQAEVIAALRDADIALAPSVRAGSGDEDAPVNTLKEAMATGLPVVATRHGGIPELVIDGENGRLVPERDPAALADAIAALLDRPDGWHEMGLAGRQKVVSEYSREVVAERTLEAYRCALDRVGEQA